MHKIGLEANRLIRHGAGSRADPLGSDAPLVAPGAEPLPCSIGKILAKADIRPFGDGIELVKLLLSHQTRGEFPKQRNRELNRPIREPIPCNREAPGKAHARTLRVMTCLRYGSPRPPRLHLLILLASRGLGARVWDTPFTGPTYP